MPHQFPKGHVFSGARARFSIAGKAIGYATNCTGSEEIQYEPVEVLDHIQVAEFVPVGYRVTFSASRVRLMGTQAGIDSLRGLGVFPNLGSDDSSFLENILNLIQAGDMNCQIEDSNPQGAAKIFMQLEQVVIASHNWAITPRGIVGEDINFLGVRMKDDNEAN
jgi:hypothetical protein